MNIYFIGTRQTDIAISWDGNKTDPFFKGSFTRFGNGQDGNVSTNIQFGVQMERICYGNVDKHYIAEYCERVVENDETAVFMPYSLDWAKKIPQEYQNRIICMNDKEVIESLDDKAKFKEFIDGKLPQASFEIMYGLDIKHLVENILTYYEFVATIGYNYPYCLHLHWKVFLYPVAGNTT